ncbi:MAG TPA: hypothetical protein VFN72_11900 [Solirubrobacterales bacterium]|nr:hypothetical protein [Solirubrobacterales bacterium]
MRKRRGIVITLTIVASILAFVATFAVWANRQLLETDTWTNTSSKLLEDEAIRTQVADTMVDTLYANVDVQAELQAALPPRLQPLAGPASAGLRQLATDLANRALQRPRVQELWENANRTAQLTLLKVVEHGGSEPVTLDLGTIVDQLGQQLGVNTAGKLPPQVAQIQIVSNDDLVKVNDLLNLLRTLAWVLTVLALGLFALAIYLAEGWRREALRAVGFAFIGVGILVLAARSLAGNVVVNALASTEAVRPAADDAWSIGTSLLNDQGGALIFYGIFIVVGAWLAGPTGIARSTRRAITPILENRVVAYSTLFVLLVLLFWWAPTPGFHRLPTALLLVVLVVVGMEVLRRQAIRDFPDQKWEGAPERWGAALRARFER